MAQHVSDLVVLSFQFLRRRNEAFLRKNELPVQVVIGRLHLSNAFFIRRLNFYEPAIL